MWESFKESLSDLWQWATTKPTIKEVMQPVEAAGDFFNSVIIVCVLLFAAVAIGAEIHRHMRKAGWFK